VWSYSNTEEVELLLNGAIVGNRTAMPKGDHLTWHVPYAAGALIFNGYTGGKLVATHTVATAGAAAQVLLSLEPMEPGADPHRLVADKDSVALVRATVVDAAGVVVPGAADLLRFSITGPATLIGTGNGDPSCHEHDKAAARSAFHGLARAVLQVGGWVRWVRCLFVTCSSTSRSQPAASICIVEQALEQTLGACYMYMLHSNKQHFAEELTSWHKRNQYARAALCFPGGGALQATDKAGDITVSVSAAGLVGATLKLTSAAPAVPTARV
jgi:hypothetical protein